MAPKVPLVESSAKTREQPAPSVLATPTRSSSRERVPMRFQSYTPARASRRRHSRRNPPTISSFSSVIRTARKLAQPLGIRPKFVRREAATRLTKATVMSETRHNLM